MQFKCTAVNRKANHAISMPCSTNGDQKNCYLQQRLQKDTSLCHVKHNLGQFEKHCDTGTITSELPKGLFQNTLKPLVLLLRRTAYQLLNFLLWCTLESPTASRIRHPFLLKFCTGKLCAGTECNATTSQYFCVTDERLHLHSFT